MLDKKFIHIDSYFHFLSPHKVGEEMSFRTRLGAQSWRVGFFLSGVGGEGTVY